MKSGNGGGDQRDLGKLHSARIEPPSSGHWKSTEELKASNDEHETAAMRLVRERRERLDRARRMLRKSRQDADGQRSAIFRDLVTVLGIVLDELEAR
jgi:hypothetical protein